MSRIDHTRESSLGIHIDRRHQIQAQQRQIGEIVLSKMFSPKVSMDTTESTESSRIHADTLEIGQLDATVISYHHVLDMSFAVDEHANLAARFVRQLTQLPCELWCNNLVWWNPPRVEFFYAS